MLSRLPLKWGDIIIIALFVFLGTGGLAFNFYYGTGDGPKYVEVYVENELVKEIALNPNEERTYHIPFQANGEHEAELEVKDGKVRMLPMSSDLCPRGICSHTGWISYKNETITCVPNSIFVRLRTAEEEKDVDGITH